MPRLANLDEKVREGLRQQILQGALSNGAHLSELKISKEYNVSRTPVREALCALAADGLIEMVPHRGAFVKEVKQATTAHSFQAYAFLMGAMASIACENSTIESLIDFENAISAVQNSNSTTYGETLQNVFYAMNNFASNPVFDEALTSVTRRFNVSEFWAQSTSQQEAVKQQLTILLGAFKRQKPDVAEKTMRQLVQLVSSN